MFIATLPVVRPRRPPHARIGKKKKGKSAETELSRRRDPCEKINESIALFLSPDKTKLVRIFRMAKNSISQIKTSCLRSASWWDLFWFCPDLHVLSTRMAPIQLTPDTRSVFISTFSRQSRCLCLTTAPSSYLCPVQVCLVVSTAFPQSPL